MEVCKQSHAGNNRLSQPFNFQFLAIFDRNQNLRTHPKFDSGPDAQKSVQLDPQLNPQNYMHATTKFGKQCFVLLVLRKRDHVKKKQRRVGLPCNHQIEDSLWQGLR